MSSRRRLKRLPAKLRALIVVDTFGCWQWIGEENRNGYGRCRWKGLRPVVHRLVYEMLFGPIPDGLLLDHLCRNRGCCNPRHTEPVTVQVNTLRGNAKLFGRDK